MKNLFLKSTFLMAALIPMYSMGSDFSTISCINRYEAATASVLNLDLTSMTSSPLYTSCGKNCRNYNGAGRALSAVFTVGVETALDKLESGETIKERTEGVVDLAHMLAKMEYAYLLKVSDQIENGVCSEKIPDGAGIYFWEKSRYLNTRKATAFSTISSYNQVLPLISQLGAKYFAPGKIGNWILNYQSGDPAVEALQAEGYVRINQFKYGLAKIEQLIRSSGVLVSAKRAEVKPIDPSMSGLKTDLQQILQTVESATEMDSLKKQSLIDSIKAMERTL